MLKPHFAPAEHISRIQLLILKWAAATLAAAGVIPKESSISTGTRGNMSAGQRAEEIAQFCLCFQAQGNELAQVEGL